MRKGSINNGFKATHAVGILFNLNNNIYLSDTLLSSSVILLPVSKQAHTISLPPGSQLAGLRFHPAIIFGIVGNIMKNLQRLIIRIIIHFIP